MHYHISYTDASLHFLKLQWTIEHIRQDVVHIQLPSWRPGRYELQNYAKNVRCFEVKDKKGNSVPYKKTNKDRWEIETKNIDEVIVSYEYYANQLDAGASYLDISLLYINPVNCFMYAEGRMDEEYELTFALPEDYVIATQLEERTRHTLIAHNFDYLADSPLIASPSIQHVSFTIQESTIHLWLHGYHSFDMDRLIKDTGIYTQQQIALYGDLPSKNYHFLYLILDKPFRHGVEHLDSTVIAMGQLPDNTDEEFYNDLLAISSHELFHLWNVKRIRPADMLPYDFTRENYSTLGYVYEGVTTYYGDLILLRSRIWSWEQYATSLSSDLKRHFDNPGRYNYSVAESSWDTWLDGYAPGIPARKVSIYMEGLIAALVADILILKNSKGKYRLDDVLNELYHHVYKQGNGYTEDSYKSLLEKYSGVSFDSYFKELIWGKGKMEQWLRQAMNDLGLTLGITRDQETGSAVSIIQTESITEQQKELQDLWMKSTTGK